MIPKPGYKTTEFIVTVLTAVGALAAALSSQLNPRYAAFAAAISTGAYAISRGLTKLGALVGPVPTAPVAPPAAPPPATLPQV